MKISIVVPAFNEERLLAGSLEAIHFAASVLKKRGWEHEIIVCDNNSTDLTPEIARAAGAHVVFEPVNQIARARNTGAAAASGDWLLFIDADSYPNSELLAEMADCIASDRVLGGGATVQVDDTRWIARIMVLVWNMIARLGNQMAGSFIFVEAAAFWSIAGFSHDFYVGKELDYAKRLKTFAKKNKLTTTILHRHPLKTYGRKIDLYSPWEIIRTLTQIVTCGGRSLRSRESTHLWYDGRR